MASHRSRRSRGGALVTGVLSIALVAAATGTAGADPAPDSPTTALEKLSDLSRKSEQTTEAMHNAQIDLDSKVAVQRDAEARHLADQGVLDAARAKVAQFQPAVDKLTAANYQGGRVNRLFAVMVSDSPQQLLDQMSALSVLSADTAAQVGQFKEATDQAATAEKASRESADAARTATEQAKSISDGLQRTQSDLQAQIAQVTQAFGALTNSERSSLSGSSFPPGLDSATILKALVPGANNGAVQAAMTQIGKPYVWGATGPDGYDCSGLMVWAYKQIGKVLPRSSQAQAASGIPVQKSELQPGDLVLFYSDASHVGMYVGNGNIVHASTFGVPVKVAPVDAYPFYGARRY
ncbi:NlpC/P60 family protein [Rhodococcus sp. NPDC127528]|uniref:C40 family peptidase n=1 Tax=unclassified Rhodococcus (in: high G+C Gram-positive bacteria) TaxID=192944 RepID=UPI00363E7AB9